MFLASMIGALALFAPHAAHQAPQEPAADPQRSPEELLRIIRREGNKVPFKVFEELASQGTPEAFEALVDGLAVINRQPLRSRIYGVFRHFKDDPELSAAAVERLGEEARRPEEGLALNATLHLGKLWPASSAALVELAQEHDRPDARSIARMNLVEHGMPLGAKALKRMARTKDEDLRYEVLLAQADLLEPDARERHLKTLTKSRAAADRLVAVELLRSWPVPDRVARLDAALDDDDPRVVRKAIAVLADVRERDAVEVLVARLPEAGPGAAHRITRALLRLTGQPFGGSAERWRRWWEAEGAGFELPDEPAEPAAQPSSGATRASFYGLPILSENVVFAIDASKSMRKATTEGGEETKIGFAKRELANAVEALPESAQFDLVHFGQRAWSWQGELVPANSKHKTAAQKHVQYLDLTFGTEIYGALREAFRDPRVDTVVLMTDGSPQVSVMMDTNLMRRVVEHWNRSRHTQVDCISVGEHRAWLEELAKATGGRYLSVQ